MKEIFLLLSAVLLFSLVPSAFSLPENFFIGSSFFEKLPIIEAGKTSDFRIKLFYKNGPYALENLTTAIDIYPQIMTRYLTIKTETVRGTLHPVSTVLIHGNITAAPDTPDGKTSLVYYFSAKNVYGNSYRSSWSDSTPPIDIVTRHLKHTAADIELISHLYSIKKQFKEGLHFEELRCNEGFLLIQKYDGTPACVTSTTKQKLIQRGWAVELEPLDITGLNNTTIPGQTTKQEDESSPLQLKITGDKQVRRGTTHTVEIQVVRGDTPIPGARVFVDIEDYGEDLIKEFKGYTDSRGYFVFSWEIPQSFDDIETLLAIIDVTDGASSKTELFKFQVYCLPSEKNCKAEGN